jgi:predicted mannosyl-3-phosphoglycerate phosphatase (HAD superfamily)
MIENKLYIVTINGERFVVLNGYVIYTSDRDCLEHDIEPERVAGLVSKSLGVKMVNLDGQPIADQDTDMTYDEVCDKAIEEYEVELEG